MASAEFPGHSAATGVLVAPESRQGRAGVGGYGGSGASVAAGRAAGRGARVWRAGGEARREPGGVSQMITRVSLARSTGDRSPLPRQDPRPRALASGTRSIRSPPTSRWRRAGEHGRRPKASRESPARRALGRISNNGTVRNISEDRGDPRGSGAAGGGPEPRAGGPAPAGHTPKRPEPATADSLLGDVRETAGDAGAPPKA